MRMWNSPEPVQAQTTYSLEITILLSPSGTTSINNFYQSKMAFYQLIKNCSDFKWSCFATSEEVGGNAGRWRYAPLYTTRKVEPALSNYVSCDHSKTQRVFWTDGHWQDGLRNYILGSISPTVSCLH